MPDQGEVIIRRRTHRAERLCQILAVLAAVWAIVALVRLYRVPSQRDGALRALAEGRWDTAVEWYLVHLSSRPDDWSARLELSVPLAQIDPRQSLIELRKIPPGAAEYLEANRQIAEICLARQRFQEAKEPLLILEAASPDDGWVHLALAEVFVRDHQAILALQHAQRAAQLDPTHVRAHFLVAEVLDELHRHSEMITPLQTVLALQPEHYAAHLNLSYAFVRAGQAGQARREAQWCLARNPNDVDAMRLLAMALRDEGKHDEAMETIRAALALSPDDLNARLLEAELLLFARRADEALERLAPLYEQHRSDRRLVALLDRTATAAGRQDEAEAYRRQLKNLTTPFGVQP
jgi:tetratricopeptide (TPR) repeat protein